MALVCPHNLVARERERKRNEREREREREKERKREREKFRNVKNQKNNCCQSGFLSIAVEVADASRFHVFHARESIKMSGD